VVVNSRQKKTNEYNSRNIQKT